VLTDLAYDLARAGKNALDFIKDHGPLIVTAFKTGAALVAAGAAVVGLGVALGWVAGVAGAITSVITAVGTVIGVLVSPLALVVGALAAAAIAFPTFAAAGGKALAWLGEQFGNVKTRAIEAFEGIAAELSGALAGIANAIKSGDIALAGKILWATIKVEWLKGTNFLKGVWNDWSMAAVAVFKDVFVFGIQSLMIDAWASLQGIWEKGLDLFASSFGALIDKLIRKFLPLGNLIADTFGKDIKKAVDDALDVLSFGVIGGDLAKKLGGIEDERAKAQKKLGQERDADVAARKGAGRQGLAADAAELKKAQDELNGLLGGNADAANPGGGERRRWHSGQAFDEGCGGRGRCGCETSQRERH
jgi:hypothetical protein